MRRFIVRAVNVLLHPESAAIIMAAGIMLSTVAGYTASAAGLFPHL